MSSDAEYWAEAVRWRHVQWRQAEDDLVAGITNARQLGVTWQAIADQFGHGNRSAARHWYERRTKG